MKTSTQAEGIKRQNLPDLQYIRAQMIARGSTLTDWARENGFTRQLVFHAIIRGKRGKKSARIIQLLLKELAS